MAAVRAALVRFSQQLSQRRHGEGGLTVAAADGKTLRGAWEHGKQRHIRHLLAHEAVLALDQVAVAYPKDEVAAAKAWLEQVAAQFPGLAIVTGDALLAERNLCAAIIAGQRDYLLRLKNQHALYANAELLFAEAGPAEVVKMDKGHGRLERREVRTSGALAGYSHFPGLRQVAEVKTQVVMLKTGVVRESTRYLLTSVPRERAGPGELLALMRGHWGVENRLFHAKDDSFGKDRHVLCSRRGALVLNLLRAAAINLLRGRSLQWADTEPLTGRAQRMCAQPLMLLAAVQ